MAKESLRIMVEVVLELEVEPDFAPADVAGISDMVQKMAEDKINTPMKHVIWWFAEPENARQYLFPKEVSKYGHQVDEDDQDPRP